MSGSNLVEVPPTRVHFPEEDIRALQGELAQILRSGQLTLGKWTVEFERAFASLQQFPETIAVNSGTSALEIILRALRLKDQEILIPTNTFAATAFAAINAGNRVVLTDIGSDLCMSLAALESAVSTRTKAVVLVHIGGLVARDTFKIAEFCQGRGIALVEDAAHAHGSTLGGRFAGTFGTAAAFSFYPTKVITAGEGGMIGCSSSELASTARILRDQGKAGFTTNLHVEMGYNWRLSEIHAAIGLTQLRRLSHFVGHRKKVAAVYDQSLTAVKWLRPLARDPNVGSNFYKYIGLLGQDISRSDLKKRLREDFGIALGGEVYDTPLHRQPVFERIGISKGETFETADELCQRHICLPISAVMSEAEARRVVNALTEVEQCVPS